MKNTFIESSITRSNLLDRDFELLCASKALAQIVDDGIGTDADREQGVFTTKKALLATRFQDFKDCLDAIEDGLAIGSRINRKWGTTEKLLKIIEDKLGRPISHGALLLALIVRGMFLERIDGRKDAWMNISSKSQL